MAAGTRLDLAGMTWPWPARIHGRGACDAKGSGAAMLVALADHARRLAAGEPGANGALLFTVDEEVGRAGARRFMDPLQEA